MIEEILSSHEEKMEKTVQDLKDTLVTIRTGKASASMLNNIRVDYYGTQVPISQAAGVTVPEPRMIMIKPWDKSMLPIIERELLKSDLGITPNNDGEVIRLQIPELTEERRKELVKQVNKYGEEHKVAIRNIRRDANDKLKHLLKEHEISEDNEKDALDKVQKLTDRFVAQIDEIMAHKEAEIMEV